MSDTEKMAPTASIETVMVVRPYKVCITLNNYTYFGFISKDSMLCNLAYLR